MEKLIMFYKQGMILPGHPNNTGVKPLLIGGAESVNAQMQYIYRGIMDWFPKKR